LLDTNAVSSVMRGEARFLDRLAQVPPADVAMPQPVVAELSYGVERLPQSRKKAHLLRSLQLLQGEIPIVPWTDEVSEAFGAIKASLEARGVRIEDFDCAIAAHAVAFRLVLVTANRAHMERVAGLTVEDWSR
jgi:predicted nucleic acid-binding protein